MCLRCSMPRAAGARVWVVSEYGHVQVNRAVLLNRALREAGLLTVRPGPFGEMLDTFTSRAFAVCDHQLAHVYVADDADRPRVREVSPAQGRGPRSRWRGTRRRFICGTSVRAS